MQQRFIRCRSCGTAHWTNQAHVCGDNEVVELAFGPLTRGELVYTPARASEPFMLDMSPEKGGERAKHLYRAIDRADVHIDTTNAELGMFQAVVAERDALRAENAALKARLAAVEEAARWGDGREYGEIVREVRRALVTVGEDGAE